MTPNDLAERETGSSNRDYTQPNVNAVDDNSKCLACREIRDEEIYILNPIYRLRSAKDYVLLYCVGGGSLYRLHRAVAVTLALCNGKYTAGDICVLARPLVKVGNDEQALAIARHKVKEILYQLRQTKEEREGKPVDPADYPSTAPLISKAYYDQKFRSAGLQAPYYNPRSFLPKDLSEINNGKIRVRREHAPVELQWHFTSECSTDCKYCYLKRRRVKLMSKERTLELIDEAASIGVLGIAPLGGDVLLYPYLQEVFAAMSRHNFLPFMLSTKSFLTKDKAKMLAERKGLVWNLQFSIDSTFPDVADYLTATKNYTQRIFASIENALEAGLSVTAKAVVTPYNLLTIPTLYRDLKKRGVNSIKIATYTRSGFHHSDDLFNSQAGYKWLEQQLIELRVEFPKDYIYCQNGSPIFDPVPAKLKQKAWEQASSCAAGRHTMMICSDGIVIPCEQMPEREPYICGNVNSQSIKEVWDGEILRGLTYGISREKFKGKVCYDCDEREECHEYRGFCIRDLSIHHGDIYKPAMNCPKADLPFLRQI